MWETDAEFGVEPDSAMPVGGTTVPTVVIVPTAGTSFKVPVTV